MAFRTNTRRAGWNGLAVLVVCWAAGIIGCFRPSAPPVVEAQPEIQDVPALRADAAYIHWLEEQSILAQARRQALAVSGNGVQWRHPYGQPQPRQAVRRASVWVLDYAGSVIPRPDRSVIATWADPELWKAFRQVGIDLLHTGPVHRSGGIKGMNYTPTTDGWFDPISLEIDPQLGTEGDYRNLVRVASDHSGLIAGDLVPLHTGMGADFRLALMGYGEYPGMYTMVEIGQPDWDLLPKVEGDGSYAPIPKEAAAKLTQKGYLPGLINNNDAVENARELSGWAASGMVKGVDGKMRRWAYLHYFKPGQPALNWLDPSYAGPRAIAGDITRQVQARGARVLRFDAVPFLGIEPEPGRTLSKHYQHPLSVNATNQLAFLTRKLGGWSFHELNVPLSELKQYIQNGPDLSYDFFTRAQCLHALLTGDAGHLRQAFRFLQEAGVAPGILVHDLQNHDEITYQLVELDHRKDETFAVGDRKLTGRELRELLLQEMRAQASGPAAPHNRLYRAERDGLATTFTAFVAAGLKIRDPYHASADQVEQIKSGHLLLAMANAMQPGVFSLSSWDLVGALPVPEKSVAKWVGEGDYRWVNRGGVDLMGANPGAAQSAYGVPRAVSLYGPLPKQLQDVNSFVSRLRRMLAARRQYRIAEAELLSVAKAKNPGVCLLVMKLPEETALAVTALNFGRSAVSEQVDLAAFPGDWAKKLRGQPATDIISGQADGELSQAGRLTIKLDTLTGKTLVIRGASQ